MAKLPPVEEVAVSWSLIKRVSKYLIPHWQRVVLLILFSAGGAYVDTWLPRLYRAVVDDALPNKNVDAVISLSLWLFSAVIATSSLKVLRVWMSTVVGERIAENLRIQLFTHLQKMPMSFFVHQKPGLFGSLFTSELAGAKAGVGRVLPKVTSSMMTLMFTVGALFSMDWRLAILAIVMAPLFQVPTTWASQSVKKSRQIGIAATGALSNTVQESLSLEGWMLHRVYQKDTVAIERFQQSNAEVYSASVKFDTTHAFLEQGLYLSVALGTTLMYLAGGTLVIPSGVTPGDVIMFATYVGKLFGPMRDLMHIRLLFTGAAVSFAKLFSYIDRETSTAEYPERLVDSMDGDGSIEVSNVSYSYNDCVAVSNVSFQIEAGSCVAIVGENGAGKSTLGLIMSRLIDCDTGMVLFGGRNIRSLSPKLFTTTVGYVGRAFMINSTVRENLKYAREDVTQEEMEEVCRIVGMHDLLSSLPNAYDTMLGESGCRLSGGEVQRLSVARGLLARPSVLILDEALSNVDMVAEGRLLEAVKPLRLGLITVLISHRLSTVSHANRVIVLDKGLVVEDGSIEELSARRNGVFKSIYL